MRLWPGAIFFIGEVLEGRMEAGTDSFSQGLPLYVYRVRVKEHFLGLDAQTQEVRLLAGSWLKTGDLLLVDARRKGDLLEVSSCGITGPPDHVLIEPMVRFLRDGKNEPGGAGSMKVFVASGGPQNAHSIEGATVQIDGPVRRVAVAKAGTAQFDELPPGRYSVSGSSAGYEPDVTKPPPEPVTVPARGCPTASIALLPMMEVAGQVTNSQGEAAPGVKLWLWETGRRPPQVGVYGATTDEGGWFRFSRVRPGRFHLLTAGAERKSYYPGRDSRAEATPLEVRPEARLENLRFVLPDSGAMRSVRFRVVNEAGRPLAGAFVSDFNFDDQYQQGGYSSIGSDVKTGPDGTIAVELFEGAHYRVDARRRDSITDLLISPHADVPPGKGDAEVQLVVHPWRPR